MRLYVKLAVLIARGNHLDDAGKPELKASFAAFLAEARIPADLKYNTMVAVLTGRSTGQLDDPACAKAVAEFKAGKESALHAFKGPVMKAAKGKANPKLVDETLRRLLAVT